MFLKEIGVIVSENVDNGVTLSLIAAGMSRYDRKRKADTQPRDSSGRWVGAGANVRWRSNGQDWAGTVEKIINGKAVVKVRHSDGSSSMTTLLPNTLKVMASKARLSSVNRKYFDENALTSDYIKQHERNIQKAAENGGARIERPDGYSVDVVATKDREDEKEKKKREEANALLYQLYAPNGTSKGIYSTPGAIDNAIAAGKFSTQPAPVSASLTIDEDSGKAFNLPKEMLKNIAYAVDALRDVMSDEDLEFFSRLYSGESISYEDVETLSMYANVAKFLPLLFGGEEGIEWFTKILDQSSPETDKHDFYDETLEYFASIDNGIIDLIAVNYATNEVFSWTGAGFSMKHGPISQYDAETIEPLDNHTAEELANKLTQTYSVGDSANFSLVDLFPEERNLFNTAMSELSTDYLDTISALNYNHAERSVDAQQQTRDMGGKFAGTPKSSEKPGGKYFAIVDTVDPTAVMDIVVVSSGANGPEVFRRAYGSWNADPDMLAQLTGPTPPNVVFLDSENQIKEVLAQVDSYDMGEEESTEVSSDTEFALKVAARNFDYANCDSDDLYGLLTKAKKFNRMDLIPEELRVYKDTVSLDGLYGEYGEVLTASAYSLGNTPLERLENYWIKGEGSSKIDWTSSDAVEYATKVFTKYLGESRAYSFATILNSKAKI